MPKINKEKCIGCDYSVSVCPEVFELGEDGESKIKKDTDLKKDCIKKAKSSCSTGAIIE
jgi:ferredoxin